MHIKENNAMWSSKYGNLRWITWMFHISIFGGPHGIVYLKHMTWPHGIVFFRHMALFTNDNEISLPVNMEDLYTAVSIYQSVNNKFAAHIMWNLSINLQYIDEVHENIMLVHSCFVHKVLPTGIWIHSQTSIYCRFMDKFHTLLVATLLLIDW